MKSLFSRLRAHRTDKDKENDPSKHTSINPTSIVPSSKHEAQQLTLGRGSIDTTRAQNTWKPRSNAKDRKSLPNPLDLGLTRPSANIPPARYSPLSNTTNDLDHAPSNHNDLPRAPSIEPLSAFEVAALGGTREEYLNATGYGPGLSSSTGEAIPSGTGERERPTTNTKKVAFISPVPTPTASVVLDLMVDSRLDLNSGLDVGSYLEGVGEELSRRRDGYVGEEEARWRGKDGDEEGLTRTIRPGPSSRPRINDVDTGHQAARNGESSRRAGGRRREHSDGSTSNSTATYPKSAMATTTSLRSKPSLVSTSNYSTLAPLPLPQAQYQPIDRTRPNPTRALSSRPPSIAESSPYRSPSTSTPPSSILTSTLDHPCNTRVNWSEMADSGYGDLVANLSPRERLRQEVLWEIISSEERYLEDLLRVRETFIEKILGSGARGEGKEEDGTPRLPSFSSGSYQDHVQPQPRSNSFSSSIRSSKDIIPPLGLGGSGPKQRSSSSSTEVTRTTGGSIDAERLPIAARFASPTMENGRWTPGSEERDRGGSFDMMMEGELPVADPGSVKDKKGYKFLTNGRPSTTDDRFARNPRSHNSLPPPPKNQALVGGPAPHFSSATHGGQEKKRYSMMPSHECVSSAATTSHIPSGRFHSHTHNKLRKRLPSIPADEVPHTDITDLPEDLREILLVLNGNIIKGHVSLHDALKQRYAAEYPLVRSLADIFLAHSDLFRDYETYVLHLEKALNQIESALGSSEPKKRSSSGQDLGEQRIGAFLRSLDADAVERGEVPLAISISKPFSRLLQYPLLFRNLLYNTDPSMKEYEATLKMVADIENIVLDIEDEKSSVEDKERTRDVFSRIAGLEQEKAFIVPRQMRILLKESKGENLCSGEISTQKRTSKRLSDLVKGHGGASQEFWSITFTDVTLVCEKIGTTSVPVGSASMRRDDVKGKKDGKRSKKASAGHRRSHQPEQRNLYKYVKTAAWHLNILDAYEYAGLTPPTPSSALSDPSMSASDSDEDVDHGSDAHSEASFSYDIPDEPHPISPPLPAQQRNSLDSLGGRGRAAGIRLGGLPLPPTGRIGTLPRKTSVNLAATQATSINAKFGTRLRSSDSPADHAVAASDVTRGTSASRARQSAPPSVRSASAVSVATPSSVIGNKHNVTKGPATTIGRAAAIAAAAKPRIPAPAPSIRPKASTVTVNSTAPSIRTKELAPRKALVPKQPPAKTWI